MSERLRAYFTIRQDEDYAAIGKNIENYINTCICDYVRRT